MSQFPQPGLGERIAYYRKLNGWSAERLAQEAGEGVTRAILAQLESGRRDSLSVHQFTAVCLALGVPPAALLADALHPDELVDRPRAFEGEGPIEAGRLQAWAAGWKTARSRLPSAEKFARVVRLLDDRYGEDDPAAQAYVRRLLVEDDAEALSAAYRRHAALADDLRAEGIVADGPGWGD